MLSHQTSVEAHKQNYLIAKYLQWRSAFFFKTSCHHGNLRRKKKSFVILIFVKRVHFNGWKTPRIEKPQRFPAFDLCESAIEPGGQITFWIGSSEVLSWLVADGCPTLLDQQTKEGHWPQLRWVRFFSPPMESLEVNRVWLHELGFT